MKVKSNVLDVINNLKVMNEMIIVSNKEIVKELGYIGQQEAKRNVIPYEKDPEIANNIIQGITIKIDNGIDFARATITATDENSIFYEYGTGIVGRANSHPMANDANWIYNLPTQYKRIATNPTSKHFGEMGWFHKFPDGTFFVTGQPANAFMFKARNRILQYSIKIAKENITKSIRKSIGK